MKILVVEDDEKLCENIRKQLLQDGFLADVCHSGETGLFFALSPDTEYDAAVIDRMLPVVDGMTIIRAMRRKKISTPVIIITGMSQIQDRVEGLDGGADDYLIKPFHLSELSARIRALIRRPAAYSELQELTYADLLLDTAKKVLLCAGNKAELTPKEFLLMYAFMDNPDHVLSREQLMQKAWDSTASIEPGNIDSYIYFLRKRLKTISSKCRITTLYGFGYMLEGENDAI